MRLFGVAVTDKGPWLVLVLSLSALIVLATWLVVSSRLGRAMVAVRDNEPLAVAAGIDPLKIRLFAFACSGAFAGLAGACYAHYISFIDPGVFGFWFSEPLLIMVVLGGSGTLWGAGAGCGRIHGDSGLHTGAGCPFADLRHHPAGQCPVHAARHGGGLAARTVAGAGVGK